MIRTIDIPQEDWFDEYDTFFDAIKRGDIDAVTAMLDAGASTEIPRDGRTPLMIAIHGHHIDIVRLLLERHAEVNNSFFDPPPIFHAVMTGEHAPEIIQLLIDHGANLEATTKDTRLGLLHWAAGHGMLHATEFLISKGLDIERTGGTEKTPLIIAAEKGQTEIVKLLHAKGADLNARSNNGGTPLIWASNGGHAETVRFLLENGARTEDCDKSGMTALSIASLEGFIEIVRMLLEKGANVNAISEKPLDATPALYAATEGHAQVLQELIRHGADLSIVFEEETTILEAAMQNRRYNTTKVLLEAIGGPDYPKDSVALQIAMTTRIVDGLPLIKSIPIMFQHIRSASAPVREFDWIEWVLDQGGDLVRPRAMRSLMHHALQTEGGDMVAELLRLGVDPNITVFGKGTPLHVAVRYRDEDTIKVLLDAGADPSRLGTSTELPMITPLHLALEQWNDDEQKDTSIIDILLATGRCKLMVGDDPKSTAFAYVLRQFGQWEDRAAEKLAIRMLESIPDVNNDRCGTGYTLMHVAVRFGETELVDFLKHKGADMNPKDECGNTPFLMACHGDPDILDFLILWGADVHAVDDHGRCALHIAAANEQVQILQLLLDLTGDNALKIDATDNLGHSPLMTAMAAGCEEAALYLLSRGASPRHRMNKGRTVFRYAAMASMHRVADKILTEPDSKDLVNEQTEDGWTPLAAACTSPSPTIISKLLSHGANINTANPFSGMTPLHLALERPLKMAVRDARNKENPAVTLLQDPNIDATARDANLRTALHFAAAFKNLAATRDLLARSEVAALVNEADAKGMTALCLCPDPEIAQLLIDYGADVNYADPNGWTPLHFAVDMRAVKTYEVLMDNGADENIRTKDDGLTVRERIRSLGGKKVWERSGYNLIMEDKMMRMRDDDMYREREDGMNRERGDAKEMELTRRECVKNIR